MSFCRGFSCKTRIFIGVDVVKDWLDIAVFSDSRVRRIDNNPESIDAWLSTLDRAHVGLVAFEPTGGYERILRRCLVQAGIPFARVHPNEIVAFRARRGVKAKTDCIDAKLLGAFDRLVEEHGTDDLTRSFDSRRHLIALLFARFSGAQSLRKIEKAKQQGLGQRERREAIPEPRRR